LGHNDITNTFESHKNAVDLVGEKMTKVMGKGPAPKTSARKSRAKNAT
jgi:hypothetical protein